MRVFVARSRHKNSVELNRGTVPFRILRQPEPLEKKIREIVGGLPAIHGGGRRCHDPDAGSDLGRVGRGCRGPPARVQRTPGDGARAEDRGVAGSHDSGDVWLR
jgi:hypothetical protein